MILNKINNAITAVYDEITKLSNNNENWQKYSEQDFIREAAICICSSQMRYEVAVAAGNKIANLNSIKNGDFYLSERCINDIKTAFIEPLNVCIDLKQRTIYPRFKNRIVHNLVQTFKTFRENDLTFKSILIKSVNGKQARKKLTESVTGFGPKQASLFLRGIGYCSDLAIIDTHILDYLRLVRGITPKISTLSTFPIYEQIDNEFIQIANDFQYKVGNFDLAIWITMRVAKKESFVWE